MTWILHEATGLAAPCLPTGPVYLTPTAARSAAPLEAQRKWMIRANSLVEVCRSVCGTSFISCQETSDSCSQRRNKELKLHAGEGPLGSRGQEKGSLWNIEGDWRWRPGARLPRLLPLLHQPTVCVLRRGNSPSCQLRWAGSCQRVCGQVGVYVRQVIYIFKSRSECVLCARGIVCVCVCVCMCGPEWVASLGSRSSEIAAAAAFGRPASRKTFQYKEETWMEEWEVDHDWQSQYNTSHISRIYCFDIIASWFANSADSTAGMGVLNILHHDGTARFGIKYLFMYILCQSLVRLMVS